MTIIAFLIVGVWLLCGLIQYILLENYWQDNDPVIKFGILLGPMSLIAAILFLNQK